MNLLHRSVLAFALLVATAEACSFPGDNVDGTWKPVEAELGGEKPPPGFFKNWELELAKGKYVLKGAESPDLGTYTTDASKKPKSMDISGTDGPNKGKTFPCIYELDGDTLRICYDLSGRKRPTEFKTAKQTKSIWSPISARSVSAPGSSSGVSLATGPRRSWSGRRGGRRDRRSRPSPGAQQSP